MSVFFFLLGSVLASFSCCMADRWLSHQSPLGRSQCPHCGHQLAFYDLIPVLSFLLLKGRCRYCGGRISIWLFGCELLNGSLFLCLYRLYGINILLARYLILFTILLTSAYLDIISFQVSDALMVFLLVWRLITFQSADRLLSVFTDALPVAGFLIIFSFMFWLTRKKQPMGLGDIKLFFVLGCYFSWERNLLILLISCLSGIIYCLIFQRKKALQPFPFVPFIFIGTILTVFFGRQIVSFYLLQISQLP